ncbi:hypothetical protein LEP1GSC145_1479 [Leptospira interrogans serovar Djasiman str. LT1649]|uniref:Uncharacterized protein n=4 Tax=Leptospira interrogans TaxID=173 RepID=A0A0E2D8X6_LEPIR|nr:hypothetical protein LEP1GSC104_0847 [Leptospira interrogans str. UI 12621]EKO96684.1 hypothetical protein LEP1GSC057_4597 [Leptospira interrogans str. Brem 329]EKR16712.1 hypothetical protein LEP1GSC019_0351 [Leptospira interrogans serovar Pyrogenes str. 2006006960]EKR37596.1 hypothetical protein LEP1GSC096_0263 [Leptospira interrogans serovar Hebdomadis str. R499]EKR55941.1 hypothetical protein LEP1GSC105_0626 [Leptospira interrogans str. UI 12758]EMF73302.1 hypothetical protein LEP1GSC14
MEGIGFHKKIAIMFIRNVSIYLLNLFQVLFLLAMTIKSFLMKKR